MQRFSLARRHDQRGAAAVEMALILIPLVVLVFGLIDLAAAFCNEIQLNQGAQAGARLAALGYSASDVQTRAMAGAPALLGNPGGSATVDAPVYSGGSDCSTADHVSVTVHFTYNFLIPLPLPGMTALTGPKTLSETGVMPCTG